MTAYRGLDPSDYFVDTAYLTRFIAERREVDGPVSPGKIVMFLEGIERDDVTLALDRYGGRFREARR